MYHFLIWNQWLVSSYVKKCKWNNSIRIVFLAQFDNTACVVFRLRSNRPTFLQPGATDTAGPAEEEPATCELTFHLVSYHHINISYPWYWASTLNKLPLTATEGLVELHLLSSFHNLQIHMLYIFNGLLIHSWFLSTCLHIKIKNKVSWEVNINKWLSLN